MKHGLWILPLLVILVLSSCFSLGSIAGSRSYRPHSELEQKWLEKADRGIYPDDIRGDALKFKAATIAWPGIIQQTRFVEENDRVQIYLLAEHHYYDWIQDFGTYHGTYWLSPRGEGLFTTTISCPKPELEKRKKSIAEGTLVILYGKPDSVDEDNVIRVKFDYIVFLGSGYNTYQLDYGRAE
jgi:hypothetical protein